MIPMTATQAADPELAHEALQLERERQRDYRRMEIVRAVMIWPPAASMTAAEVVAAAVAVEAFITRDEFGPGVVVGGGPCPATACG